MIRLYLLPWKVALATPEMVKMCGSVVVWKVMGKYEGV